jgi:hypothetical protein
VLLENGDPTRPFRDEGLVLAALLAIGVFDLPYGYYQFLRLAVCVGGIALAVMRPNRLAAGFGIVVAILFNPLWTVHFTKDVWRWVDGSLAIAFFVIAFGVRSMPKIEPRGEMTEGSLNGDR